MSERRRALICGISGQDGAWLARLLLNKGYTVIGSSRDAQMNPFTNLKRLGIDARIETRSLSLTDFRSVLDVITATRPDEIYNLAGQSSVGLSFEQPVETLESNIFGTLNLLEAIRFLNRPIRFYNAGSSECFGDTEQQAATEATPFRPRSPYAVAKAAGFWEVSNYREAYGLYACTGILFNHESPLRPPRFVIRKIISTAVAMAAGSPVRLRLGNLDIWRDWGCAEEYVEAMWQMLQQEKPDDFIIATGQSHSLQAFLEAVFAQVGLDWQAHVILDPTLFRPTDLRFSSGNPEKARRQLGWQAKTGFSDLVARLLAAETDPARLV